LTKGENMPRLECPKCKEGLNEIIRVIEIRCRYDEEEDDYLNETGGDRFLDLCPKCKTELETF
jgi:phage FluMu protein Com